MPRPVTTERRCCCAKALPIAPGEVPVMKAGLPVHEFLPQGRAPQYGVLEGRGNGAVMFRGDNQHAVGARQFVFEAHHFGRQVTFIVLVVHRQVVDAGEARGEPAGAKPDQRPGQFAIDGIAAIAADDHGDARQMRGIEHG